MGATFQIPDLSPVTNDGFVADAHYPSLLVLLVVVLADIQAAHLVLEGRTF
jgi:hypothetical protein